MVCPSCMVQMHQKVAEYAGDDEQKPFPIGGGVSDENQYTTWELKECPSCKRQVTEFYSAILVPNEVVAQMLAESLTNVIHQTK